MEPEPDSLVARLVDHLTPLYNQVLERLDLELDDRGELAILEALTNAAVLGYRIGIAELVGEQEGTDTHGQPFRITVHPPVGGLPTPSDMWEKRYGDG